MSNKFRLLTLLFILSISAVWGQDPDNDYRNYLGTLSPEELISEALGLSQEVDELRLDVLDANTRAEGGWSSNGGGFHLESSNIWFINEGPISYCVDSSEDYPLKKIHLRRMVRRSINEWRKFFTQYKLHSETLSHANENRSINFPDEKTRKLNFKFKETDCEYDERGNVKDIDGGLVFLFGKSNPVTSSISRSGETQLGFALRKKYDHKTYKTTGYVWIENFSDEIKKVYHLLLHEMGHVFGMKHDTVFVMDEDVAYQLKDEKSFTEEFFGKIESKSWMYRLEEGKKYIVTSNQGRKLLDRPTTIDRYVRPDIRRTVGAPRSGSFTNGQKSRPEVGTLSPSASPLAKCLDEDYMPNKVLPQEVRELFQLQENGCHKVVLSYVRDTQNQKIKLFTLELINLRGTSKVTLRGMMDASRIKPNENPSPGVYTNYVIKSGEGNQKEQWLRMILDKEALMDLPVLGQFRGPNTTPLATKIINRKGLLIEIFLPKSKKWWVLNNIHNRFIQ